MGWFSPVQVFWNNLCFASETSNLITKAGGEVDTFGVESNPAQRKLWIARNMTYEYIWFSYDVLWESLNSKLSKPSPKVITIFYGVPTIPTFSSTVVMAVSVSVEAFAERAAKGTWVCSKGSWCHGWIHHLQICHKWVVTTSSINPGRSGWFC